MAEKKKKFHLLRWLFGGGLVTVVVVVAVVLLVLNASLGAIVQKAVTAFGPKLTGTDIQVEKVKLSLLRGDLLVTNLVVGNPEGYKTPSILEIGELHVKMDPMTVFKDTIHVKLIDIQSPQVTYEVGLGNSNVTTLLEKLSNGEEAENEAEDEGGKRVVIDEVKVADGSIHLAAKITGGHALPVPLPTIRLSDLGKTKEEVAAEKEAAEQSAVAETETVRQEAAAAKAEGESVGQATREILASILGSTAEAVKNSATEAAGAAVDGVKSAAGAAVDSVKNAAGTAVDGVKNAAGAAVDGVKNLFGGDQ
ncbi:MAG: hypothetical protein J6Y80_01490 [Victivallales bacterium]|nr:hypothetical protein [Victivallales bacterium]